VETDQVSVTLFTVLNMSVVDKVQKSSNLSYSVHILTSEL